jgi:hypothetical protein
MPYATRRSAGCDVSEQLTRAQQARKVHLGIGHELLTVPPNEIGMSCGGPPATAVAATLTGGYTRR